MLWFFKLQQFLRSAKCVECDSRQQNKQEGSGKKRAAPSPVLNQPRMASPPHQIQSELTERSKVHIQKEPWSAADRSPEHVRSESNSCQTIYVVQKACWEKRV